ncbi:MAG: protein kinase domain-containing protein, partial [Pirellulaceae bacterium]
SVAEQNLLRSFLDVCNTIDYCHARGVVHRDIKPQNVVVGSFGETIVLDWGLASVDSHETTSVQQNWTDEDILSPQESIETIRGSVTGTPAYMPPEQAGSEFHRIGRHSDIYSLGAMLYHMIVGQPAFTGGKSIMEVLEDVRAGRFPRPRSIDNGVPGALEAICLRAMQRDPQHRYENVEALSEDVERFMADEPVSVYREPIRIRCRRWIKKNRTLATGLAVAALFALAASIVGAIIYANAQAAEVARLAEILDAAEQAENAGLLQLRENRFESAMQFFEQSTELVADEPELADVYQRVAPRAERLRTVVEAYDLAAVAQEALYHDQISKAAIYAQTAVRRLGIMEHPDWWNHLPVDDMNPEQVEFLRQETYRLWGMWSTMRFAELTEEDFSFPWLLKLLLGTADTKSRQSLRSSMFAAQAAIRYRPSTMLRFILFVGNKVLKREDDFQLPMKSAENASDAAMIGSILDTHASDNRLVMRAFLGRQDPETVADALLLDGIANIPQWYWLAVFAGKNQLDDAWEMPLEEDDDGQRQKIVDAYQRAIRTYSHAVGINKNGWLAYSSRALAYTSMAWVVSSEEQRNLFFKNAVLDIARAEAIAPNHPQFLRDKAYVLRAVSGVEEIANTYTHSVFNRPYLDEVRSHHFATILGKWIWPDILKWEKQQKDASQFTIESTRMAAAVHLWKGDVDKATERIDEALEMNSDDVESRAIKALIELKVDNLNADARTDLQQAISDGADYWCTHYRLGQAWQAAGDVDKASKAFEDSLVSAQMDWQLAWSDLALATIAVLQQDAADAQAHYEAAIAADLSIDLTAFDEAVRRAGNLELAADIQQHADFIAPWFRPDQDDLLITRPALVNGGFEIELAHGWGESRRGSPRIWEIKERFWTNAGRDIHQSHSGIGSFRVNSDRSPDSDEEMSLMVQQIPVTPGQRYRVSVWARARAARSNTLGIYSDDQASQHIISIPAGDYEWQQLTGEFTADSELLSLVIACRDEGTVWIDDIEIDTAR